MEQTITDFIDIPTAKVYRDRAIYLGTFLGGPLVAGYMIASNFRIFNEPDKARKAWIYSILAIVVIFGIGLLVPAISKLPPQVIPLLYTYVAFYLVKHYQAAQIQSFLSRGGRFYGWGRAIVIGLIGLGIFVAVFFGFFYFVTYFKPVGTIKVYTLNSLLGAIAMNSAASFRTS